MAVMARRQDQDFEALQAAIAQFPDGASLEQISEAAALPISERTLIRRLADMVERGDLRKSGGSRAARYFSVGQAAAELSPSKPMQKDMFVPVGKLGGEILRLLMRPAGARKPVGYNRDFLSSYKPNRTSYLTADDKARLSAISKTVDAADQRAGTYAQRILARLLIDLSWNSSRLEGNTYSLLDTQRLIEAGEPAEGKAATDAQMILNHKAAIEFLVQSAEDIAFNRYTILNLHALLAENLLPDPSAAGRIRQIPVNIGKSVYHPLDIPQVLNECFDEILAKAQAIADPFEQSFFVMVHPPYLQPFEDVNKRVSRLAANIPLFRRNLAPIAFVDVPDDTYTYGILGVYELNRIDLLKDVFLWAYERSAARYAAIRQTTGEPDTFRLRHRQALKQVVSDVIREPMDQKQAAGHIALWAGHHVPDADRARFVEIAETELMSIHEGNFARYQIRPSEYQAWQAVWNRKPDGRKREKRTPPRRR
jgi:fido (protein-threonine AMPylation protein)